VYKTVSHGVLDLLLFHVSADNISADKECSSYTLKLQHTENSPARVNHNMAVLNKDIMGILATLATDCTFEAYSPAKQWATIIDGTDQVDNNATQFVDIIIYGKHGNLEEVSEALTARKVYLQEPDYWEPGLPYINPHFLDLSAVEPEMNADERLEITRLSHHSIGFEAETSEEQAVSQALLKERVSAAFRSATRAHNLQRIAADARIQTKLKW